MLEYEFKIKNWKNSKENEEINIIDFIKIIYNKFFEKYYFDEYNYSLFNISLRNIFQWLYKVEEILKEELKRENKSLEIKNLKEIAISRIKFQYFIESLKDIFILDLIKTFKGIDFNFFDSIKSNYGTDIFVRFLLDNNISYEDMIEFKPIYRDNSRNISSIILSQYFNIYTSFPRKIEWAIKGILFNYLKTYFMEKISYPQKNLSLIDVLKYFYKQKFLNKCEVYFYYLNVILYKHANKISPNLIRDLLELVALEKLKLDLFSNLENIDNIKDFLEFSKKYFNKSITIKEEKLRNFILSLREEIFEGKEWREVLIKLQKLGMEKIYFLFEDLIILNWILNNNNNNENQKYIEKFKALFSGFAELIRNENKKRFNNKEIKSFLKNTLDSELGKEFIEIVKKFLIQCNLIKGLEEINNIYGKLPLIEYRSSIISSNSRYSFSFLKLMSLLNEILNIWQQYNQDSDKLKEYIKNLIIEYVKEENYSIIGNDEIREDDEIEEKELDEDLTDEIISLVDDIINWLNANKESIEFLNEYHLLDINNIFKDFYEVFDKRAKNTGFISASMYIKVCLYSFLNSNIKLFLKGIKTYIKDIYKFDQLNYLDDNLEKIEDNKVKEKLVNLKNSMIECPLFKPYLEENNIFEKVLVSYEQKGK